MFRGLQGLARRLRRPGRPGPARATGPDAGTGLPAPELDDEGPLHAADADTEDADAREAGTVPAAAQRRVPALAQGARRARLVALTAAALLQALFVLVAALAARRALDATATPMADSPVALQALGLTAISLLCVAGLRLWQGVQGERLAQDHIRAVRLALFDTLATLSPAGRERRSRGAVMLRFMGDAQALRDWAAVGAPGLIAAVLAGFSLLAGLALLAAPLALLAAGWFAIAALGMAFTLPPLARRVREARLRQAHLAALVHDRIATVPVMQAAAQGGRERSRLDRRIGQLAQAQVDTAAVRARHRFVLDGALAGLGLSVLAAWSLAAGGGSGWHGALQGVGVLVGALGLIGLLAAPLRRSGRALEQHVAAAVARDRIADFLADAEATPPARSAALPRRPVLRLAGLCPAGRSGPPLAAEVPHGRCIAITGAPGSGKTALLETLARLRPLADGEVELGERALGSIGLREFAHRVSHVAADAVPLRGSVEANLRYRRRRATAEQLQAAATAAGWPGPLDEAALALRVRDGGANLGGRQRRALVLARALVGQPAVLLVDELEHLLDADAEAAFAALRRHHRGTLIFSTHDPRLAALADTVWDLGAAAGRAAASSAAVLPLRRVGGTAA
jgi:ABC-type multidrug transport system fused ATPase/permease subunit